MALSTGHTTVNTVRVQIDGQSPNPSRLHIHNMDNTKILYIGNENVTTANGFALQKLDSIEITLNPGESVFAISETGDHLVTWLRQTLY